MLKHLSYKLTMTLNTVFVSASCVRLWQDVDRISMGGLMGAEPGPAGDGPQL